MAGKVIDIDYPEFAQLGLRMAIHDPEQDIPVSSVLSRTGAWEAFLTRQMIALTRAFETPAFYDIGANIGWYSLIVAAQLQQDGRAGRVFAVEPSSRNRDCLARSVMLNGLDGRVELIAGAASDFNGAIELQLDPVNFGNHRVGAGAGQGGTSETARAHRLDDLVAANGWPLPTLIKADVQGHEMQALRGFGQSLARSGGWVMAIEWMPDEWPLSDMLAMLGADGVYQVDEQARAILPTGEAQLLALHPTWPSRYFDLLVTRGARAEQAVRALKDFEDRFRVRFVRGAGALMQNDRRRVSDGAMALVEPLQKGLADTAMMLRVKVLVTPGQASVRLRAKGCDGRESSVLAKTGEVVEIPLTVGSGAARLGIRLIAPPGAPAPGAGATAVLGPIEIVELAKSAPTAM